MAEHYQLGSSMATDQDVGMTGKQRGNDDSKLTMDAFEISKIKSFKNFGFTLECIAAYDDFLLVCIKGGQLLLFEKTYQCHPGKKAFQTSLQMNQVKTQKNFSSSPVSKMMPLPDLSCLLVQYGEMLNIHDINTFEFKAALESTRGVSYFDVIVKEKVDEAKKVQVNISAKLAVAVGKKLRTLKWNGETFIDDMIDRSNFSKPVRSLLWCGDVLFVAYKNEYFLVKPETNEVHDLFTFGVHQKEPLMIRVEPDVVMVQQEKNCVFVDSQGKPAKRYNITWSGVPRHIAHNPPYITAILPGYIEVKTLQPCISVQRIDMKRIISTSKHDMKHITSMSQCSDVIYLESHNTIHMLSMLPVTDRIKGMMQSKHFELAIQILEHYEISDEQKKKELGWIEAQQAVHLFCLHKYEEAFGLFQNLNTDPSHVVGLFPQEMIPKDFRTAFEYPEKIPTLQGAELKSALVDLIIYLTEKRKLITRDIELNVFTPVFEHRKNVTLQTKDRVLQLIDTMLLRCYIQTQQQNDTHLNNLISSPDNKIIVQDAVSELKAAGKYKEMINLYKMHQMHETALGKLKVTGGSNKKGNISSRTDLAISYLQDLGEEHIQLILKHAEWILEYAQKDGLKLFITDTGKVRSWPPVIVKSFLEKKSNDEMAIDYLEHVIYEWKDGSPELHYSLSQLLKAKIAKLQAKAGSTEHLAKNEKGPLGECRRKLIKFLKSSKHYKAEEILPTFPINSFFEERALLLGSMGRHEAALGIYLYVLGEHEQAEDYCLDHYSTTDEKNRDVFLMLVKVYLSPPSASEVGLSEYQTKPISDTMSALSILQTYAGKIDLLKALKILPEDLTIKSARTFLEVAMETVASRKHKNQIRRAFVDFDHTKITMEKLELSRMSILIDENTVCDHCEKKIGKSIFARTFDEQIMHLHCAKNYV